MTGIINCPDQNYYRNMIFPLYNLALTYIPYIYICSSNYEIHTMISLFRKIFGKRADIKEMVQNGAIILDVRTVEEYRRGHAGESINIPLDSLPQGMKKLDKSKVIITCCESGMRSAAARRILVSAGFEKVYNGGTWRSLAGYR